MAALIVLASTSSSSQAAGQRKLLIVGFAVAGEALQQRIVPAFVRQWAARNGGEQIVFEHSYGASSTQARNVIQGLDADIVYLSDWTDMKKMQDAGLIKSGWDAVNRGTISKSIVVFRVHPGNPKNIRGWQDLQRPGVRVVTPNPRTSGAARWNLLALYGAALKATNDPAIAEAGLRALYRNVVNFGDSGRATTNDFERGLADVALMYENEVLLRRRQGREATFVIPNSTIIIENPATIVDLNVDKHGTRDVAEAFIAYLKTPEAQRILMDYGFRSIDDNLTRAQASRYPAIVRPFEITYLGGWPDVQRRFFDRGGLWDRIIRSERRAKS